MCAQEEEEAEEEVLQILIFLLSRFLLPISQVQKQKAFGLTYCCNILEIVAGLYKILFYVLEWHYLT